MSKDERETLVKLRDFLEFSLHHTNKKIKAGDRGQLVAPEINTMLDDMVNKLKRIKSDDD